MTPDHGECVVILQDNGDGGIKQVRTYVPASGKFEDADLTNLYLLNSPEKVHHDMKKIKQFYKHQFDTPVVTPKAASRSAFVNIYNASLEKPKPELEPVRVRLFPRAPPGLADFLGQFTISIPFETAVKTLDYTVDHSLAANLQRLPQDGEVVPVVAQYKQYKPVERKTKPVLGTLPDDFKVERHIVGDPLADLPVLSRNPSEFEPLGRYTQERRDALHELHKDFLWPEELKLMDQFMCKQNEAFAWEPSEGSRFNTEFFPPIVIPVIPHIPWVQKNIPIPPGSFDEIVQIIKDKIAAGVYEPTNSSYRSRWFCVLKKDGKSLRLVHSLEPLNQVTIAHSGVPPATEEVAEKFAGRSCLALLDLFVGYDQLELAKQSRDLTAFQTPLGAMRLVTLPMGWTNAVPIFHEHVTYILRDEIPEYTWPYIDDVPVRGPATRYELSDGTVETLVENPGIRRFVWEHFENLNRITQRVKYAGGKFSGKKAYLCCDDLVVLGHCCGYRGRTPEPGNYDKVLNWGVCSTVSEVRAFLGTAGLFRTWILNYAKIAKPIQDLTRTEVPFEWGEKQIQAQAELKECLRNCPALKPLRYLSEDPVILAVDTSYLAIGFYICQLDQGDAKRRVYARFGSITLNEREARFSQPKRELYGLFRALKAAQYWLRGCRNLIIEVDAKYIKGMLENPDEVPNAALNRWIEYILHFQFKLVHVPGRIHGPDGLSRRPKYEGDTPEWDELAHEEPLVNKEDPLEFETFEDELYDPLLDATAPITEFKDRIDTRHGFVQRIALNKELNRENERERKNSSFYDATELAMTPKLEQFMMAEEMQDRTEHQQAQDEMLKYLLDYLEDPTTLPSKLSARTKGKLQRFAKKFFARRGKLYLKDVDGQPKCVLVHEEERIRCLGIMHDQYGHKGQYSLTQLVLIRFWWPGVDRDCIFHVNTCHLCQIRQKTIIKRRPTLTQTPGIFQEAHIDAMNVGPSSPEYVPGNGKKGYSWVVVARCGLSKWIEGEMMVTETADVLGEWIFRDILCRWGCIAIIRTDNGGPIRKALKYIASKYGITGTRILPYNKGANGVVERGHWDFRQSLFKATNGELLKWPAYFHECLWAERITVRRSIGMSPFQATTGKQPLLPLDIEEATWLGDFPDEIMSTEDLIGIRARQLSKHADDIKAMQSRVERNKLIANERFERDNEASIKDYNFETGMLVLVRNSKIEMEWNKKFKPRFLGPFVVITRTKNGGYLLAELDGSLWKEPISEFRVIPYKSREVVTFPKSLLKVLKEQEGVIKEIVERDTEDQE